MGLEGLVGVALLTDNSHVSPVVLSLFGNVAVPDLRQRSGMSLPLLVRKSVFPSPV